ncbi:hypothetical protein [Micromonospora maritima]|uniref:hypothetical protein n=1 Tax=Micromonospora maritima TaxID=986711 RepID=UPI00157E26D7|nr:hypothetical protein [Micromonospora maritima]
MCGPPARIRPEHAASTTVLRVLETMLPLRLAAAGLTTGHLVAAVVLGRGWRSSVRSVRLEPGTLARRDQRPCWSPAILTRCRT